MKRIKSMRDVAFEEITKAQRPLSLVELYNLIALELEMTEEEKASHIGALYTDLTLDGRFVALTDNTWDLRSRHTYEKVHIDVKDVYSDVEESEVDKEEQDENEEKELGEEQEGGFGEDEEEKRSGESLEDLGIGE